MANKMAVSYERVSDKVQLTGDGLARQRRKVQSICTRYDLTYDEALSERLRASGISAYRGKNLEILIERIEDGTLPKGYTLVVEDFDRLSRLNAWKVTPYLGKIVESGIEILVLNEGEDDDDDGLIVNLKTIDEHFPKLVSRAEAAHRYSKKLSNKLCQSWQARYDRAKGKGVEHLVATAVMPLGYTDKVIKTKNDKYRIAVIDEPIAELIRKVFADYIAGKPLVEICEELNAIRPHRRGKWQPAHLSKIVRNRAYIGEYQPCNLINENGERLRVPNGKPIINYYPRIINQKTWDKAQAKIKSIEQSKTKGRKRYDHQNLLTGLAVCPHCGNTLMVVEKVGRNVPRLMCQTRQMKLKLCPHGSMFYRWVAEATVLNAILGDLPLKAFGTVNGEAKKIENQITKLDKSIAEKEKEVKAFARNLGKIKTSALDVFTEQLQTLETDLEKLREQKTSRAFDLSQLSTSRDSFVRLRNDIADIAIQAVCGVEGTVDLRIQTDHITKGKMKIRGVAEASMPSFKDLPENKWHEIRSKLKVLIAQVIQPEGIKFGEKVASIKLVNGSVIETLILSAQISGNWLDIENAFGGMYVNWYANKAPSSWARKRAAKRVDDREPL